jgi:hypothetical protein
MQMKRHKEERQNKFTFQPSKYTDRWGSKEYKEDQEPDKQREVRKRWRNAHKARESSWVSQSTPLEDLVSLSPRMKISGKILFAFHEEDKYSKLFDDSSDEKEKEKDVEEEEEKIPVSPNKPKVAPITKETLRLHQQNLKEMKSRNFISEDDSKRKEDSPDSFTSISTDIQNAIHYDLLENEIYHT